MIKATISSQYEFETEEDHHFIAVQIFDAMMFAGAINIGNLVWNSLTAMYSPDVEVLFAFRFKPIQQPIKSIY